MPRISTKTKSTILDDATMNRMIAIMQEAEQPEQGIASAMEIVSQATWQKSVDMMETIKNDVARSARKGDRTGVRMVPDDTQRFYALMAKRNGIRLEKLDPDIENAVDAEQRDIFPNELIVQIFDDLRDTYPAVLNLLDVNENFVQRWFTAEYEGVASWSGLLEPIRNQVKTGFNLIDYTISKLTLAYVIPNAIADLEIGYVDQYFRRVSMMLMYDGVVEGAFLGTGKNQPVGWFKEIDKVNEDGTHKDKPVDFAPTAITPTTMIPVLLELSKNGQRAIGQIALVCNTADRIQYVDPALLTFNSNGQWVNSAYRPIQIVDHPIIPRGKAAFCLPHGYKFGFSGIRQNEHKDTLALEDASLYILKAYGNGRAKDDHTCVMFDPTHLQPLAYPVVLTTSAEATTENDSDTGNDTPDTGNDNG